MKKKWMLRKNSGDFVKAAEENNISLMTSKILSNRNVSTKEDIKKFLYGSLNDLYNPLLMKDMDLGTNLILGAIKENKKILIYGDYDADGVTSTVILYKALKKCDANVLYYIPNRENEGYGLNKGKILSAHEEGVQVILTCDNGISGIEEIKLAKNLGMAVVVTDHHELTFIEDKIGEREYIVPCADAVIDPKQNECAYPFKLLCGAGIALKFVMTLFDKMEIGNEEIDEYIEFAGIGTICDVVDLIDENRIIAKEALKKISNTKNVGLMALKNMLKIEDKVSCYHVGFIIGPCINATGRLESADISVELLLEEDYDKAVKIALQLISLNKQRQQLTNDNSEEIINLIQSSDLINDKVLVIYKENLHESVAGIVAGRIREKYNLPTIVISSGKDRPKGSGRSIENYNMFEELNNCRELIYKFGGHPMAAGLSIEKQNIDSLRKKLNENFKLTNENLISKLKIDSQLHLNQISDELINGIEILEPFGKGNEGPLFGEKSILTKSVCVLGKDKNVLKFELLYNGNNRMEAVAFNCVEEFKDDLRIKYENYGEEKNYGNLTNITIPPDFKIDLVFSPCFNTFNNSTKKQLKIVDFRIN